MVDESLQDGTTPGPSQQRPGEPRPWTFPEDGEPGAGGFALELARAWIEANMTTAVLGAFATGVFLGVLARR